MVTNNTSNNLLDFIHKNLPIPENSHWKADNHKELLIKAASHNTYLEIVKAKQLPDPDTFHLYAHNTALESLRTSFLKTVKKQTKKLKTKHVVLILDETHEPFYGHSSTEYIHAYKPKNGCTGSFRFFSASILTGDQRLFVDAVPVHRDSETRNLIESIINAAQNNGLIIECILMDRGISRVRGVLELLNSRNIDYLGLYPRMSHIRKYIKSMKRSIARFEWDYTDYVIIREEKHDWVFATNMNRKRIWRFIQIYKKRWNIETGFRVQDEARIKTKTIDIRVRYFLFLASMVLYNVWKCLGIELPFKRLIIRFSEVIVRKVFRSIGIP